MRGGGGGQEDREFKVILSTIVSLKPDWVRVFLLLSHFSCGEQYLAHRAALVDCTGGRYTSVSDTCLNVLTTNVSLFFFSYASGGNTRNVGDLIMKYGDLGKQT